VREEAEKSHTRDLGCCHVACHGRARRRRSRDDRRHAQLASAPGEGITINNGTVTQADMATDNGVVRQINRVLQP
jgi:hypothetical protein